MRTEEFNHIILPMRSDLKAYALRLTESDDNAEDLVQEVMLRLWGHAPEHPGRRQPQGASHHHHAQQVL